MNKPAAAAAAPSYEILAVEDLRPSPTNPRRIDDKHPSLPGLAESIKAQGVLEPILVREINEPRGQVFEILAGERRWRAARLAGVGHVPCLVRTCDDQQAFEITVTENLQREDLHWLEEARGVEMMVKKGWEIDAIAKQLGKSPAWVQLRAKLATISEKWRKAAEEPGSVIHRWPVAMLELVARLPIAAQDEILKEDSWDLQELETAADLRQHIERSYLRLLKSAPWDLDDAKLMPKAGACSACPKRSSCQQALFAEVKGDSCLDAACWTSKQEAHAKVALVELKKKAPDAIVVTDGYHGSKGILGRSEYDLAKASDKGAKQAIITGEDKEPKLVYVRTGANRTGRNTASAPSKAKGEKKETPPKERLAEFMKRRKRAQIKLLIAKLGGDPDCSPYQVRYGKSFKAAQGSMPNHQLLVALVVVFGVENPEKDWKDAAELNAAAEGKLDTEIWKAVQCSVLTKLAWNAEECETGGAEFLAKAWSIDWRAIVAEAQDKLPLPKTLAAIFAEDGTPLTVQKHHQLKKYNPDKILEAQGLKRKSYVKETASGAVRTHDLNYSGLLKKKIAAEGLSLQQAAKNIGVSVPALRKAIIGKSAPNARTAGKYCKFLGLPLAAAAAG